MTIKAQLILKCTRCKKRETMTPMQAHDARDTGVAISSCCRTVAIVERVTTRRK